MLRRPVEIWRPHYPQVTRRILGRFQGEYERKLNANTSFALSASYVDWADDNRTNLDAKLRLYPQEHALQGLGLGASLGLASIRRNANQGGCDPLFASSCSVLPTGNRTVAAPTFAVEGQYQWLLGPRRVTAVTAGFGVKRYFVNDSDFRSIDRVLPTGRLTLGYAF